MNGTFLPDGPRFRRFSILGLLGVTLAALLSTEFSPLVSLPSRDKKDATYSSTSEVIGKGITIVTISDRPPGAVNPLRALINSLLLHSTIPISFHLVTRQNSVTWLDELQGSRWFSVTYHSPQTLLERSGRLIAATNFTSTHPSKEWGMAKLFLALLDYGKNDYDDDHNIDQVLMLDDDLIFYQDIGILNEYWRQNIDKLILHFPIDPVRTAHYFMETPNNGHSERYCISGSMALPISKKAEVVVELFELATRNMMREYPTHPYRVNDQDVVNRAFAENYYDSSKHTKNSAARNDDLIRMLPCEWFCDPASCPSTTPSSTKTGGCFNCNIRPCKGFHFLNSYYTKPTDKSWPHEDTFQHYINLNPKALLTDIYEPRFHSISKKQSDPE